MGLVDAALGRRDREGDRQLPRLRRADPGTGRALARPDQGSRGEGERRARAARCRQGRADRRGRRPDRRRRARRPVPDRRLPDRLRHLVEHERERGDRLARRRGRASRTTTSTWGSPRTTCSPRPSTSRRSASSSATCCPRSRGWRARSRPRRWSSTTSSSRAARTGWTRSRHARPGVRRLRGPGARRIGADRLDARAARARSRSAAPPSAPGSTPIPSSPRAYARGSRPRPG